MTAESFPRLSARTQRFTLGAPRNLTVAPDGSRVVFLRSASGTDRTTLLWVADVGADSVTERIVADPRDVFSGTEELSAQERARRERAREGAGGVVGYATDGAVSVVAFGLSGSLYVADLSGGGVRALSTLEPVIDPRPDPTGRQIAYVAGGAVRVVGVDGTGDRELAGQDAGVDVSWGLAEFIAAEEMGRYRGFWWSPDGEALLVARTDNTPVRRWHIADPAQPGQPPAEIAYPAAGTPNALVSLHLLRLDRTRVDLEWDRVRFEYLAAVHWSGNGNPLLLVQTRDQRTTQILEVETGSGATAPLHTETDPVWIDLIDGVPSWSSSGELIRAADSGDVRRLHLGRRVVSGDLQVRGLLGSVGGDVLFAASADEPTEVHVYLAGPNAPVRLSKSAGVHTATAGGPVVALACASLDWPGRRTLILRDGILIGEIASHAMTPPLSPAPQLLRAAPRDVRTALLLPTGHVPGTSLPVLMDPYGGPHAQRVTAARNAFNEPQWWADQGFAVVVADGRGTPGRGTSWEQAIAGDVAGPILEDQIDALHAAAKECPDLDLSRVGIRGWSFGGYLAALAVLRRPEIFHAAIAGAPVTDWALYDTHYTERYLGHPDTSPEAYARTSLITGAAALTRPLLLVHGLADDNVVAAHTLQLSGALLAAGRPHQVLPLSGVTHMTPQEVVAENLLLFQLDFLRKALGVASEQG
ncbi:prolyl oligopeptidase family serine peptidase [Sporichthya sp.]|uniref:S9 family peptidase n=1 Tax=Sporichthya sp. TaxID=65475 RepID=UPI00181E29B7|nr:prolyl oligopeptidase family serine peptidase [Sporichthya sp.]MBA3742156.1 S9 family peptidase [Sporichthya sp.]